MKIVFTKHAWNKFDDLAELGFSVTERQVEEVLENPEKIEQDKNDPDLQIAQKKISVSHTLRVVFSKTADIYKVITFYPSRHDRY